MPTPLAHVCSRVRGAVLGCSTAVQAARGSAAPAEAQTSPGWLSVSSQMAAAYTFALPMMAWAVSLCGSASAAAIWVCVLPANSYGSKLAPEETKAPPRWTEEMEPCCWT